MIRPLLLRAWHAAAAPRALTALVALAAALPAPLLAQASGLGRQTLGRPYWHLFAAYALGIILIGGWVVSISRRLRRVEQRLPDLED